MEALMAGKPKTLVLGAMRALLPVLRENWGDLESFLRAGLPVLDKEAGGAFGEEEEASRVLEQLYRQVMRTRALYFRPITNPTALDNAYKELEAQAAESHATVRQGVLWLASRMQQAMLAHVATAAGQTALEKLLQAVDEHRGMFARKLGQAENLSLEQINWALSDFVKEVMGPTFGRLETAALSGHLMETLRAAARKPPELDPLAAAEPESTAQQHLLGALTEPTRAAELNDARARFARMDEAEKNRRFNDFRLRLSRIIQRVAPYAPRGLEVFCQAVEAALFPYPAPLEYIRVFAKPIYDAGRQSTLFTDTTTVQSVNQRYEALAKSRQVNPVFLELARAFALRGFQQAGRDKRDAFVKELNLHEEFHWPASVAELQAHLRSRR